MQASVPRFQLYGFVDDGDRLQDRNASFADKSNTTENAYLSVEIPPLNRTSVYSSVLSTNASTFRFQVNTFSSSAFFRVDGEENASSVVVGVKIAGEENVELQTPAIIQLTPFDSAVSYTYIHLQI